jgi:hypothetical protein
MFINYALSDLFYMGNIGSFQNNVPILTVVMFVVTEYRHLKSERLVETFSICAP